MIDRDTLVFIRKVDALSCEVSDLMTKIDDDTQLINRAKERIVGNSAKLIEKQIKLKDMIDNLHTMNSKENEAK